MTAVVDGVIEIWAMIVPVAAYTTGGTATITPEFRHPDSATTIVLSHIAALRTRLDDTTDHDQRSTVGAVPTSLETQLNPARPSGRPGTPR